MMPGLRMLVRAATSPASGKTEGFTLEIRFSSATLLLQGHWGIYAQLPMLPCLASGLAKEPSFHGWRR